MKVNFKIMRPKGFHASIKKNLKKCIDRVSKNSGWKKRNFCPICKSRKSFLWLKKLELPIYFCQNCTSKYTGVIPKNIKDVYDNKAQFNFHLKSYEKNRKYRVKRFGRERVNLITKFKKKGELLDIGCGDGWFFEAAMKKFNVSGIEENIQLCEFVKEKLKIDVFHSLKNLKKNFFDVITLFDVIEHVEHPIEFLNQISNFLKKGGVILIFTPNSDSLGFHFLKEKNNLIIPPYHLTYFNLKSFEYLPKKFQVIYKKTFGMDFFDIFAYQRDAYKIPPSSNNEVNKHQKILDKLNFSNHVRVVLRKK